MIINNITVFGVLFVLLYKIYCVNRRDFENFFGQDAARIASYFRWDTEKAGKLLRENFGSTPVPTASVTSGLTNEFSNSRPVPRVFEQLSINNRNNNEEFNKDFNHRFGSLRSSVRNKMNVNEHFKLNQKIKRCAAKAKLIGGKRGKELFHACKREYNRRLNKSNTEEYINTYVHENRVTPSSVNRYMKKDMKSEKIKFKKDRIRYLDGKNSNLLFREHFNNKEHFKKNKNSQFIKTLGKIFRYSITLFVTIIMTTMVINAIDDKNKSKLMKSTVKSA
jgi:hypothetical protein